MSKNYSIERTLSGFPTSINCLRFGPLGDILAIGSDDGVVTLVDFAQGTTLFRWVAGSPVTALYWQASTILFAGYGDGGIARFDTTKKGEERVGLERTRPLGAYGVVEHLEYHESIRCLAVVLGEAIILCYLSPSGSWDLMRQLPSPTSSDMNKSEKICPRSAHFSIDGKSIVVSYLKHGIWCLDVESGDIVWKISPRTSIGKTSFSAKQGIIVTSNLYDGFDCYNTTTRSLFHTFRTRITHNVPLPVQFIHGSSALLFGSACGDVSIWDLMSHNWEDSLRHAETEMIQALDYTEVANRRYIATGLSEQVGDASVRIWSSSRPQLTNRTNINSKHPNRKRGIIGVIAVVNMTIAIVAVVYATIFKNDWCMPETFVSYRSYIVSQVHRLITSLKTSPDIAHFNTPAGTSAIFSEPSTNIFAPPSTSIELPNIFVEPSALFTEPSTLFTEPSALFTEPSTLLTEPSALPIELSTVRVEY